MMMVLLGCPRAELPRPPRVLELCVYSSEKEEEEELPARSVRLDALENQHISSGATENIVLIVMMMIVS